MICTSKLAIILIQQGKNIIIIRYIVVRLFMFTYRFLKRQNSNFNHSSTAVLKQRWSHSFTRTGTYLQILFALQLRRDAVMLKNHSSSLILFWWLLQGSITAEGSFQQLQETGLDFTKLLSSPKEMEDAKLVEEAPEEILRPLHTRQISVQVRSSACIKYSQIRSKHEVSFFFFFHFPPQSVASSLDDGLVSDKDPKPVEETQTKGSVGLYVYRAYFAAGGNFCFVFSMFFLCFFAQVLASGSDAWITYW